MEIEEFFEVSVLLGYYKELLSDKQKIYMEEHFEEDYSFSEIAARHDVTRQTVHDNIRRGIDILREYETKLGFYNRDRIIKQKLISLKKSLDGKLIDEILDDLQ